MVWISSQALPEALDTPGRYQMVGPRFHPPSIRGDEGEVACSPIGIILDLFGALFPCGRGVGG